MARSTILNQVRVFGIDRPHFKGTLTRGGFILFWGNTHAIFSGGRRIHWRKGGDTMANRINFRCSRDDIRSRCLLSTSHGAS